jgi:hypothetical protein
MPRNSRCFAVVVCLVLCLSGFLCAQTPAPVQVSNAVTAADSGIAFHVGQFDVAISGEINGFYVHDRADRTGANDGGCVLCSASAGAQPSSSIRNGLLPGDLSFKLSTREYGWDTAVFFGIWPEIQNSAPSALFGSKVATNVGGNGAPNALGTPGIDFRQQFVTFGRPHFGTVKIGRDLGLFGQEAILNDFTILGAGTPNGNTAPGSVTLGRIGVGYIYTDFVPQITYTSPSAGGLQVAFAVIQPEDDIIAGGLAQLAAGVPAATALYNGGDNLNGHGQPQFQGKFTYKVPGKSKVKTNLWVNFLTQSLQQNSGANLVAQAPDLKPGQSIRASGVDYGLHLGAGGANLVLYGYNGTGIGIAGTLLEGVAYGNGVVATKTRPAQGYYVQGTYTIKKNTLGVSYGQSVLSAANSFDSAKAKGGLDLNLISADVRCNSSWVGQYRYALTHWVNLVGEYTHTRSESQAGGIATSDSIALGTIAFF